MKKKVKFWDSGTIQQSLNLKYTKIEICQKNLLKLKLKSVKKLKHIKLKCIECIRERERGR